MNIKLLTVSSSLKHTERLDYSLRKYDWDYDIIQCEWKGFGTKLLATRQHLLAHPEIDGFFFADAFDVVAVRGMKYAIESLGCNFGLDDIVCSAEKGCWPDASLSDRYDKYIHGFNYLNSGLYYAPRDKFLGLFEYDEPEYSTDDQLWFTKHYLFNKESGIVLDNFQIVFNSHSFISLTDKYQYHRSEMEVMGNTPSLVHFNGKTVDEKFNKKMKV